MPPPPAPETPKILVGPPASLLRLIPRVDTLIVDGGAVVHPVVLRFWARMAKRLVVVVPSIMPPALLRHVSGTFCRSGFIAVRPGPMVRGLEHSGWSVYVWGSGQGLRPLTVSVTFKHLVPEPQRRLAMARQIIARVSTPGQRILDAQADERLWTIQAVRAGRRVVGLAMLPKTRNLLQQLHTPSSLF